MALVSIPSLWAPIVLAAALVFLASAAIHMFLGYHANDFRAVPDEDGVMAALRPFGLTPGDYLFPFASGADTRASEGFRAKAEKGPVGYMTVLPPSTFFNMAPQFIQWFAYCLVVGVVSAYVAGRTLGPGEEYLVVFRLTGTVAFACYALALPQRSIWYSQSWSVTAKSMFDGLVYALLTAGAFGWLWPA